METSITLFGDVTGHSIYETLSSLILFFWGTLLLIGFDIPSCEYMKLMTDSGIPPVSLVVLFAMVMASGTRVAEKLVKK